MSIRNSIEKTEMYVGCVVDTRERNYYDDSDFYAIVWNGETFVNIEYATTRFSTYHINASVDATPEIRAKYEQFLEEKAALAAYEDFLRPCKGKKVTIVQGRKHKGKAGEIIGVYDSQFKRGQRDARVKTSDGEIFYVPIGYCEVIKTVPAPVPVFQH